MITRLHESDPVAMAATDAYMDNLVFQPTGYGDHAQKALHSGIKLTTRAQVQTGISPHDVALSVFETHGPDIIHSVVPVALPNFVCILVDRGHIVPPTYMSYLPVDHTPPW